METSAFQKAVQRFGTALWVRLSIPVLISLLLFILIIFGIHLPELENSVMDQKKSMSRNLIQAAWGVLTTCHSQEQKGLLTRQEAKDLAVQTISNQRFGVGGKQYFWISDLYQRLVMHPYRPDMIHKDLGKVTDPTTGKHLFADFITATEEKGDGFVSYHWQRQDDGNHIVPKLSYVKRFHPWGWIVGTEVYLNDIAATANVQIQSLLMNTIAVHVIILLLVSFSMGQGLFTDFRMRKTLNRELGQQVAALNESEAKFRMVLEVSPYPIVVYDDQGHAQYMNPAFSRVFGWQSEELLGRRIDFVPDACREETFSAIKALYEGTKGYVFFESQRYHKSGRIIEVSISAGVYQDPKGKSRGMVVNLTDITDRKNREREIRQLNEELEQRVQKRTEALSNSLDELKNTQQKLVESEKMASLGGLVAGVAHEINTPLGLALTNTTFLDERLEKVKRLYQENRFTRKVLDKFLRTGRESLDATILNLKRAVQLVQGFKQVAVDQVSESRRFFKVCPYIGEVLQSLRPRYNQTQHTVELSGDREICIDSYPGTLMQIVTNLVINSLDHGFDGIENGKISICVKSSKTNPGSVIIKYSDNGRGMSQDQLYKIYEPFYTTKRGRGGTGLGMHIVYNLIVQQLAGTIDCESNPRHGTTFTICLPAMEESTDEQ